MNGEFVGLRVFKGIYYIMVLRVLFNWLVGFEYIYFNSISGIWICGMSL